MEELVDLLCSLGFVLWCECFLVVRSKVLSLCVSVRFSLVPWLLVLWRSMPVRVVSFVPWVLVC